MDQDERDQQKQQLDDLRAQHADEIKRLGEEIDSLKDRNKDLENAIEEIYNISRRV